MFRGMIDEAKAAAHEVLARVATRAAIGGVFLVALGFGIAALTMQLVDRFGGVQASWMLAIGFAVIGLIGVVSARVHDSRLEERKLEEEKVAEAAAPSMSEATSKAAMQMPLALIGSILTSTSGFISPLTVLRFLGRNVSLVVFGGILAVLLWPAQAGVSADGIEPVVEPAE